MKLLRHNVILGTVLAISLGLLLSLVTADSRNETKAQTLIIDNPTQSRGFFAASYGTSSDDTTVTSPVLTAEFSFNALTLQWKTVRDVDFDIYVRFNKESWTEWIAVAPQVDFKDDGIIANSSQVIFSPYTNIFQYKLVFPTPEDKELLTSLSIEYIDSTKAFSHTYQAATTTNSGLTIVSRKQWGADESYRFNEAGQEIWQPEYYKPEKFVLHHTASTNVSDPAATVRAIYYWHAKSNKWGDIGYNYLIDSQGVIYEGRYGGDGVVGGHAYMNNRNTIGIAVLGCYDSREKNCNTPDSLTDATRESLKKLIAAKSQQFSITPEATSRFGSHGHIHNILGHGDLTSTYCPGQDIYRQLGLIRDESKKQLASLPPVQATTTNAQLVSVSARDIAIPEGTTGTVRVQYKNTGNLTWRSYQDFGVLLGTDVKKLGSIKGVTLASTQAKPLVEGARLVEGNVAPGQIGTFVLDLPAENATKTFTLAWQGQGYYPDTDVTITTKKIAQVTQTPTPVRIEPIYKALLESTTMPQRIPAGTSLESHVRFYNIGNATWKKSDLVLEVTLDNGQPSPLLSQTQFTLNGDILPGTSATFSLPFKADHTQATYIHTIVLRHGEKEIIRFNHVASVISPYSGVVTDHNFPVAIKNTWRPTVTMTIQNVGSETWVNPTLKSTDVDGTLSWFFDWSWLNKNTVQTKKMKVAPGESVTFTFKLKPYWKPNTYPHVYKLWSGSQAITLNGQDIYERWTRVDK